MKKNNTKTTERKQRKQLAAKLRRQRRLAVRDAVVEAVLQKRLKPLSRMIKDQQKMIEELQAKMAAPGTVIADE